MDVKEISIKKVYALAENGGRILASVGQYELRDGIRHGVRSCFIFDNSNHGKQYLIPASICDEIHNIFALGGDRKVVYNKMEDIVIKYEKSIR